VQWLWLPNLNENGLTIEYQLRNVEGFYIVKQINDKRFYALDVFRGATIVLRIIVNTPGSGAMPYSQLLHADWNDCTLTDLVFPSFLFAVGNAMSF
jgi:hypothetical protein